MNLNILFPHLSFSDTSKISSIENDSRVCCDKTLFIAYTGFERDLIPYIPDAYSRGCRYFLVAKESSSLLERKFPDALIIPADNIQEEASRVALAFYDYPDKSLCLIGITGTNGKTTVTTMISDVLRKEGYKTALFGTLKWQIDCEEYYASNTTPDFLILIKGLKKAKELGVTHVVLEVASHALSLGRVYGLNFDLVGWTNLSHDHLDYHRTIEAYFDAKSSLFLQLFAMSEKSKKQSFINVDDQYGNILLRLMKNSNLSSRLLSMEGKGDFNASNINLSLQGSTFDIHYNGTFLNVKTSLLGKINIENLLMVYAICNYVGTSDLSFLEIAKNVGICGRFEKIETKKGVLFFVDFAHTSDALEKSINVLKNVSTARVIVVFGAGGDRDPSKRKKMAQATKVADFVVLTSDNPRTEDPEKIARDVMLGFDDMSIVYKELDRKKALEYAYHFAEEGDLVLVAGKGHENYQILGTKKIHFSDQEEIKRISEQL